MEHIMKDQKPRGIAVVDAGYTNTKIALFSPAGEMLAEHKIASRQIEGPPYRHIDPEPLMALCREALPALDLIRPVDAIIPCGHGAAMGCVDEHGNLALPVMDYTCQPPAAIVADYTALAPKFDETYCMQLPMALTHALQLYWQSRAFPQDFARVKMTMPWMQYVGFRLSGKAVIEISSMSCQTHLMDTRHQTLSSFVKRQGWEHLFPRMAKAWETIGYLKPEYRGTGFRGEGRVLGGVHDSTANFMRYVCSGLDHFTLVSTGTWCISFDPSTPLSQLVEARDTNTNTDVLGRTVACSRFFGGKEFEIVSGGVAADRASLETVGRLVARGTMALPSFTDSGGPVPGKGGKGHIVGPPPADDSERASLAALYCAEMVSEQLDAIVADENDIIVDGPFSQNSVLLQLLAQLRPRQRVLASDLRDGTTAGAAAIALIDDGGRLPAIGLKLTPHKAAAVAGLAHYHKTWKDKAYDRAI